MHVVILQDDVVILPYNLAYGSKLAANRGTTLAPGPIITPRCTMHCRHRVARSCVGLSVPRSVRSCISS